jgi:hypothetical protein
MNRVESKGNRLDNEFSSEKQRRGNHKLKKKTRQTGNVNFMALEELKSKPTVCNFTALN